MRFDAPTADTLRGAHPEWTAWVNLLQAAADEIDSAAWQSAELRPSPLVDSPLVADATLAVDAAVAARWVSRLFRLSAEGCDGLSGLARASVSDPLGLLEAAVRHDCGALEALATQRGADVAAFIAVAALAPVPLLHAVREHAEEPEAWHRACCPVCGDWPTLVENRGVERERRFRCGRCGGDWHAERLLCPYCGMRDHRRLGHLVSETDGEMRRIDTCEECRGYVKVVTTLTATPAPHVLLQDLATVDLDVAALAEEYHRPAQPGASVRTVVRARSRSWRPWTW